MDIFFSFFFFSIVTDTAVIAREVEAYLAAMVAAGTVLSPFTEAQVDLFWDDKWSTSERVEGGARLIVEAMAEAMMGSLPRAGEVAVIANRCGECGYGALLMAVYAMMPEQRGAIEALCSGAEDQTEGVAEILRPLCQRGRFK